MIGPFGAIPTRSHLREDIEPEAPKAVAESTMAGNIGPSMGIGSAFLQRPRLSGEIARIEDEAEERERKRKPVNATPRVGCDNMGKLAYTMEDLMGNDGLGQVGLTEQWSDASRAAAAEKRGKGYKATGRGPHKMMRGVKKVKASNASDANMSVGASLSRMKERPGMHGRPAERGKKSDPAGTKRAIKHSKKARAASAYKEDEAVGFDPERGFFVAEAEAKSKKKLRAPSEPAPGEFNSASGGTTPGKREKIKIEAEPGEFDSASGGTAPGKKKKKIKVEKPGSDDLDEGKKKLHPSMLKHVGDKPFKAHVGDPEDEDKPFHKGKGLQKEDDDLVEFDAGSSKVIAKLKKIAKPFGAKFKIESNAPHFLVTTDADVGMLVHGVKKVYPDLAKPKTGYIVTKGPGGKKVVIFKPQALAKYESADGGDDLAEGGWNKFMRRVKGKAKKGKLGDYLASPEGKADRAKAKHGRGQDERLKKRGYKVGPVKGESAGFDKDRGFFVAEGEKTRKQRSAENKAKFDKLSPEEKAKTRGNKPFHPSLK